MKRSNEYRSAHSDAPYRGSPALGVIVMVALTVLFVAVLGSFSFGISLGSLTTPQVSMSTEINVPNDQVQITHIGGDPLSGSSTNIAIVNESDGTRIEFGPSQHDETLEVGESVVITTTTGTIEGWTHETGNQSFELRSGTTYTITIVDTDSEVILYQTSLTSA